MLKTFFVAAAMCWGIPLFCLLMASNLSSLNGQSIGYYARKNIVEARGPILFYLPFSCFMVLAITFTYNYTQLGVLYMVSVAITFMVTANYLDRQGKTIAQRAVRSLLSFLLIGYVLYKSDLFRSKPYPNLSYPGW